LAVSTKKNKVSPLLSPNAILDGHLIVLRSSQETATHKMAFYQSYEHARPRARR
jgi:hypothetical protein